jgi:hypothetical protein
MKLDNTAALAKVVLLGLIICCLAVQAICDEQSPRRNRPQRTTQSSPQDEKQYLISQLTELHSAVNAFIHHRNAGDRAAAKADAELARAIWNKLPRPVHERLEIKHPGSAELLEDLDQLPAAKPASETKPPATVPATMPCQANVTSILGISLDETADSKLAK